MKKDWAGLATGKFVSAEMWSRSDWLSDVLVLTGSIILGYRLVSLTYLDDFKRVRWRDGDLSKSDDAANRFISGSGSFSLRWEIDWKWLGFNPREGERCYDFDLLCFLCSLTNYSMVGKALSRCMTIFFKMLVTLLASNWTLSLRRTCNAASGHLVWHKWFRELGMSRPQRKYYRKMNCKLFRQL